MEIDLNKFIFFPFLAAFFTTVIITPLSLILIKKFGIVDDPAVRRHPGIIHSKPIPRGGGIPLFLGALIAGVLFLPINKILGAIFFASFIALVTGVLDDKYDLSPYLRFIINIICALIIVAAGVSINFITNPLGGILYLDEIRIGVIALSDVAAILWIVWVMNMLNWSKGVDGQMPGIVAISAIFIGILSMRFGVGDILTQTTTSLSFIIAGASLGFLIYNFHPAKIFPGYGATSIYLLLAVVSILSSAKLATAILVMGVPLADGAFTIIRRIITGRSPFWHDKKHLHHLLLSTGAGQRQIALFYWIISAIFGALALILSSRGKIFAIIMLVIIVGGVLLFLNYLIGKKNGAQNI
ncbi:MAG: undecaprenyl/decaprenyl-phosphate alpha-N-acetylglucosaminyl 1-phosphate transferase [Candidatus Levybacteria bacterium]|nr:undecaprenyl/decaprenyl-phosphate alpha-N-acetylglucosaminyl 1-phosphate transferase [Candidatus Levybacteria bacterium]